MRGSLRRLPFALLALGALVTPLEAAPQVVETEHYRLHVDGTRSRAAEFGRVLEAAWPQYEAHFGSTPRLTSGEKLTVRFFDSREAWEAALQRDGTRAPGSAGGYYWPASKTAYLYRQPTAYFTRTLLVHEAAHQFHYLARTRNRNPTATWYTEGVAEHLSWHRWDGARLELGVVPGVTLKDYPAAALAEARAPDFDLETIVSGRREASRAMTWALYRFLATGAAGRPLRGFKAFARKMDAGGRAEPLFRQHFGRPRAVQGRLVEWLTHNQTDWAPIFNEWEQIGSDRMRGHAGVVTACRLKADRRLLAATVDVPAEGRWRGGLLLHYAGSEDYTVALLDGGGWLRVNRRAGGRWLRLHGQRLAPAPDARAHRFEARRRGAEVMLTVDGLPCGRWALPGQTLGLALENCDLRFRDLRWE